MAFLDTLPTPNTLIGPDGQLDAVSGRAGPGFAQINFNYAEPTQHAITPSGRYELSRAANPHIWKFDINYNELLCDTFHIIYPFLLRKQESMETFYVELPQYFNQGLSNKTIVGPGAGWGFNTVVVQDGGEHVTPGTVFNDPNGKLYVVTRVETPTDWQTAGGQPAANTERLHVAPTWQVDIPSGTLYFVSPKLKVRLVNDLSYTIGANNLYSFSISLEEAV